MAINAPQRAYRAPCPGCGAPVEFKSAQSTHAVCSYCQSAVVRDGETLKRIGKIRQLGVTNFDTPRLRALLDAGIPVVSHQVQCSLLDRRALGDMATLCAERGVGLLTYGALAGGFFHERWLGVRRANSPRPTRSSSCTARACALARPTPP